MAVSNSMLADPDNFRPGVKCKYQETLIGVLESGDNYIAEKIWESLTSSEVETLERIVKCDEPELYDGMVITNVHIAILLHLELLTRTSIKSKLSYVACTAKGHMVWESSLKAGNKSTRNSKRMSEVKFGQRVWAEWALPNGDCPSWYVTQWVGTKKDGQWDYDTKNASLGGIEPKRWVPLPHEDLED